MREVRTTRLLLRPFTPDDVDAYAAIRSDPLVMRHLMGGAARAAHARRDAERLVPAFAAQWDEVGYGPWAACARDDGRLLGHLGLRHLPEVGGRTELLYMLERAAWGRGLATEGAAAALAWAWAHTGLQEVVAFALPANTASWRVMERVGMRPAGIRPVWGVDARWYRAARPEL
ncbi:MAG: GNAT family N-acetyltransferase [Thermoleophilia bacterium]|nr:GNAT family N-acetyltransferase [Thermoleophilia bacterium]